MNRYQRVLLSLDVSPPDPSLISYTNMILRLTKPACLEIVNVVDVRALSPDLVACHPALVDASTQSNLREIRRLVTRHLQTPHGCAVRIHVFRGNPVEEILRHTKSQEIDLVILGRDPVKDRGGTLPERLARIAPCSLLIAPKEATPAVRSILVPIDFSTHSATAIKRAIGLGRAAKLKSVYCLHVYDIPGSYRRTGLSFDEFSAVMKQDAEKRWQQFRAPLDTKGLSLVPLFRRGALPTQVINDEVAQSKFELVVMGARGKSAARNLLLGTEAQRLINATQAPLVIVKSKREATGFFEALLGIFGQPH